MFSALSCRALGALAAPQQRLQRTQRQVMPVAASTSREQPSLAASSAAAPSAAVLPRRAALAAALAAAPWLWSGAALADNDAVKAGLNRYVKKKKLERLDTYVPPLLEARGQLIRVGRVMLQDPAAARELLRSGVFGGLRDNVRSLGEYASQCAGDASGTNLVRGFFTELEGFDGALRQAARGGDPLPEDARTRLEAVVAALDALLATVPADDFEQAQRVVAAIQDMDAEAAAETGRGAAAADAEALSKLL
ncbi:hypothetical protein C2E20_3042 [Micractinium conductrix]|uniref:DUF7880 domain-containing protein n=1 Tax=Micractinium conductrix TaxID=554055 RepID=A0A2P6VHQ9_9CHLO|nr:hypothetical protein C2E20_3042 [Micractinium conductrix]|eukprot:PSC73623.1 hypothetical protein C2E20_3042 [Micractinium conductrix]